MTAARAGDPDAWDRLFREHQRPLHVFVAELLRDRTTALDVVQETFIAAARHIGGLREDRKFASWLFGIARQKCAQHWRRRKLLTEPLDETNELELGIDDDPLDEVLRVEDQSAFFAALERLPLPQREVLVLHFLEEFPLQEIAEITATPLGTVKSRIHHARRSLQRMMRHENTSRTSVEPSR